MPTSDNCVPGPGCVQIEVGQVDLPGIEDDPASGEPFGHREPGPPGLGVDLSLDVSDLRPGYALWSRWNPYSSLGQAGRDVFGEERPIATWSLSPAMTRAVMGVIPVAGMNSLMAFSDTRATPRDKAIAVALDALTVVGVGVLVKLAGKVVGGASKARSAARAGVEALEELVGAARGGGSILREASEATFRAADDMASWVPKNKHILGGGSQSKAQFATTNFDEVQGIVQEALRSPNAEFLTNPNLPGTFRVVTNLGRPLGVQGQEAVRVIVDLDGKVINAFPVHMR
ncbi:hypothetical protein WMF04_45610 [Sorangium sp. So ce260]|uniref:hypothetical protein n=1 Tax=Sorangium sp. So ce260 TaxID=3133291 RepID=UPI003F5F65AB